MRLSKGEIERLREAQRCPAGEHAAVLVKATKATRPTGLWVELTYQVGLDHQLVERFLVKPARADLEGMSLDHLEMLLQAVEATLGVDEVEDLAEALTEMKGRPVRVEVSHVTDRAGKVSARISAWRSAT